MKSSGLCVLLLLLAACASSAAFLATAEFLGFSDDGKYAALEQYWIADGSGFPRAEIMVLSVTDNSLIRSFEVPWTEDMMYLEGTEMYYENTMNPARRIVLEYAESFLDSIDISPQNESIHCVHHPITDTSAEPDSVSFVIWVGSLMYRGPEYSLKILKYQEIPEPAPDWLSMFDTPVLLETVITDSNGNKVMHLRDDSLQPGFEYVSDYRIRDIYVYNDSLVAIILNTTEPGFEGPDGMFRMVTGVIGH